MQTASPTEFLALIKQIENRRAKLTNRAPTITRLCYTSHSAVFSTWRFYNYFFLVLQPLRYSFRYFCKALPNSIALYRLTGDFFAWFCGVNDFVDCYMQTDKVDLLGSQRCTSVRCSFPFAFLSNDTMNGQQKYRAAQTKKCETTCKTAAVHGRLTARHSRKVQSW